MENSKPVPITNPNFDILIDKCQGYIDAVDKRLIGPLPVKPIFDAAIEAVFGANALMWVAHRNFETYLKENKGRSVPRKRLEHTDDPNETITFAEYVTRK